MNRQMKLVLIGLVVLGLLFAGSVGLGFRSGNDKERSENDDPPGWTKFMGKILPEGKPYVALKNIKGAGSFSENQATINSKATITINPIGADYLRKVKVKRKAGGSVEITYLDNLPNTVKQTSGKNKLKTNVSKNGGTLTITPLEGESGPYTIEFVGSE